MACGFVVFSITKMMRRRLNSEFRGVTYTGLIWVDLTLKEMRLEIRLTYCMFGTRLIHSINTEGVGCSRTFHASQ